MDSKDSVPPTARPPRILIVYKKSAYQLYALERRGRRVRALLRAHAESMRVMQQAHEAHLASLEAVEKAARATGAMVRMVYRANLRTPCNADVLVTVGGDGTLLDASHRVVNTPLLGVNSNPARSVGYLTAATAGTFAHVLDQVLRGRLKPRLLMRLAVRLNDRPLGPPVLNDVLFCHANPAATSRYALHLEGTAEEQKSSGVWIATPAGSTAAILSAGGQQESLRKRRFQFLVREPYAPPGHALRLVHGFVPAHGSLSITNYVRQGALFLDGAHLRFKVAMGDVISITAHPDPLSIYRPENPV